MRMLLRRAAPVIAAVASGPAWAGPLLISPTTVELDPVRHNAAIAVTNQSDLPADLQLRAFAWSQDAAGDQLAPTSAVIVSPPIATLPPHGRQVFRVLAVDPSLPPGERSFRLKLNELPRPGAQAVTIAVEFSLPVFLTPPGAAPALDWSAAAAGPAAVEVGNRGTRRVRIASLALKDADGARIELTAAGATYLLAGTTRRFALPPGARLAPGLHLVGVSDAGSLDVSPTVVAVR